MFIIKWIRELISARKLKAKFTLEDRMNITDPDWRDDVVREQSYGKLAAIIFGCAVLVMLAWLGVHALQSAASAEHSTVLELLEKTYHHVIPHVSDGGKDLIK